MTEPPLLWDIFCRVIDNHGDLGVCWRLSRELAARGQTVRLWVDDARALHWMAPGALHGSFDGVRVLPWTQPLAPALLAPLPRADVWVEAFGCDIAPEFIAAQAGAGGTKDADTPPVWLNLEYLSAEPYVERMHGLPSPVLHGPAAGWHKWFFYPGFTARTGGLLREHGLFERQAAFDRAAWRQAQAAVENETLLSLFCYEPPALASWLADLRAAPTPSRLLATAGRASAALHRVIESENEAEHAPQRLSVAYLPWLTQTGYDHLLWACDLNFVRGEDSLVRALWADAPLVWHIYPQHDGAHHAKLDAFLHWLDAPASLRRFHRVWNGLDSGALPTPNLAEWRACFQAARQRLLRQDDLVTQLLRFTHSRRKVWRLCDSQ
ncbi:MAG: elongation factor P maturation arginine rhamnosyltransferase EarP [Burkholderiaceae bacterium]|nr:elongation factor P maturation arginine rhamnosyltransferase EarP [Burkholderiaceae bacterium]